MLTPELFHTAHKAIITIKNDLASATNAQLFTAAVVVAKIRVQQGAPTPMALCEAKFESIGHAPDRWTREDVLSYLLQNS
jgi:hypothetical protein